MTTASDTGPAPESAPWPIGLITLGVKRTGKRRTGNPFAPFEVAGAGDGLTATLHGHEAGNGGYSQGGAYGAPHQSSTLLRARCTPSETLDAVLAADARLHLGHGVQPRRGNPLGTLHAHAVLTVVQPVESVRQTLHALHQPLARGEADLPALVGLDLVNFVGEAGVVPGRAGQLLNRYGPAELAKSKQSRRQVVIEPGSDVIHGEPPRTS